MKRRMSAALRVVLENQARPIARAYVRRTEELALTRQAAPSMMELVQEILRRGCMVSGGAGGEGLRLAATQQWLVNLDWLLQRVDAELGPAARHVLVERLTRPKKSELASFERIASDITLMFATRGRTVRITTAKAEGVYRAALIRFVELLDERGIACELPSLPAVHASGIGAEAQHHLLAAGQALQRFAMRHRQRCGSRRAMPGAREARRHDVTHGARI